MLVWAFLKEFSSRMGKKITQVPRSTMEALQRHPWPGNVRELENTMQRASVLATADVLLPKDIPLGLAASDSPAGVAGEIAQSGIPSKDRAVEALFQAAAEDPTLELLPWLEREFTLRAMEKTGRNQVRAAKLLGITRATLRKRLDRNGGE